MLLQGNINDVDALNLFALREGRDSRGGYALIIFVRKNVSSCQNKNLFIHLHRARVHERGFAPETLAQRLIKLRKTYRYG